MAIRPPGQRFRYSRLLGKKGGGKRSVTAVLELTAMVDMFTVLVVFLLQNYSATGEVIFIPKEVTLPQASSTKELKPALVVTISRKELLVDKDTVISFEEVKNQKDWLIKPLQAKVSQALLQAKLTEEKNLNFQVKEAVGKARGDQPPPEKNWDKITLQSDKDVDFLTIKKVLYTLAESGAGPINYAVNKTAADKK